jgi:hypothetical protein
MTVSLVSKQTKKNWWVDLTLSGSALMAAFSGVYFLFLPSGGYRGGRNFLYNVQFLFTRQTWDDLHTWGGVAMIAAVIIHLASHWKWVVSMTKRIFNELFRRNGSMNPRARWNLILNLVVGLSFLLVALSGVYFLFFPGGHAAVDPLVLFTRTTWEVIHTWAGVMLTAAAMLHFAIHWKWIVKVTTRLLVPQRGIPSGSPVPSTINS